MPAHAGLLLGGCWTDSLVMITYTDGAGTPGPYI
jgi:hypothetical protein